MAAIVRFLQRVTEERRRTGASLARASAAAVLDSLSWRLPERLQLRALEWAVRVGADSAEIEGRLAQRRLEDGRVDDAIAHWRAGTQLDPDRLRFYHFSGYEEWQRGRWDEAHGWFERLFHAQRAIAARTGLDRSPLRVLDVDFTSALGTLAHLDVYVKQQVLAGEPLGCTLLFGLPDRIGNRSYLDYWLRWLPSYIEDPRLQQLLAPVREALYLHYGAWPRHDGTLSHYIEVGSECERRWEAEGRAPLLSLTGEHRERGRAELRKFGIPDDAWFVGLHARWSPYHDLRNAEIDTYWKAITEIVERGGWVLRFGDRAMPRLRVPEGMKLVAERVVDYLYSESWSDWMDVFILAEGRFLLGSHGGPIAVPGTFGVPAVGTNWCPMGPRYWYSRDLYIPKRYWSDRESRLLSFPEILGSPVGFTHLSTELAKLGVRAIDNTADEIRDVVVEMLDRLDGKPVYTEEDEALYGRFDQIEPPLKYRIPGGGARIGREFLRASVDLVEGRG